MNRERKDLLGLIFSKITESSTSDLHQLVEILYEEELKQPDTTN